MNVEGGTTVEDGQPVAGDVPTDCASDGSERGPRYPHPDCEACFFAGHFDGKDIYFCDAHGAMVAVRDHVTYRFNPYNLAITLRPSEDRMD